MAYFDDLSVCAYFGSPTLPTLIAVGWLEHGHSYATGDPGAEVRRRLKEFRGGRWQPFFYCGGHVCNLCSGMKAVRVGDETYSYKNLFIPGHDVTYVAPEGIAHYVTQHEYHPPRQFCEALLATPPVDSPEYLAALAAVGWPRRLLETRLIEETVGGYTAETRPSINSNGGSILFAEDRYDTKPSNRGWIRRRLRRDRADPQDQ